MKRITLILRSLRVGGIERVNINLALGFAQAGYAVDLVLLQGVEVNSLSEELPDSVHLIAFDQPSGLRSIPSIIKYLSKTDSAAVIVGGYLASLFVLLAAQICRAKVPIIVVVHSPFSYKKKQAFVKRFAVVPLLVRILYPRAVRLVAVSERVARDIQQALSLVEDTVEVIPNPVVSERLLESTQISIPHPWLQSYTEPVCLWAGRMLYEQKDIFTLIQAFNLVRQARPIKLILLGSGPDQHKVEDLIKNLDLQNDIDMPGMVTNVPAYMVYADVFVFSSIYEGFGMVLVEALACGLPVVSTDCPFGPAEILAGGKYGKLVPVKAPEALAQAIAETLDNPPDSQFLRERANDFSVEKATQAYINIVETLR